MGQAPLGFLDLAAPPTIRTAPPAPAFGTNPAAIRSGLLPPHLKPRSPPLILLGAAIRTQTGGGNLAPALDALDQAHGDLPAENREPCQRSLPASENLKSEW